MHLPSFFIFALFSLVLAFLRIVFTDSTSLFGLVWNLVLALLPYIFSLLFFLWNSWMRWICLLLWVLFLPNSFYILTDFVHLYDDTRYLYFDIVYIMTFSLAGMVAGYASIEVIHRWVVRHLNKVSGWILSFVSIFLSMFGVYIGRFLRFNSWDIISDPLSLFREILTCVISNGTSLSIHDPQRFFEAQSFSIGMLGLWQFTLLYGVFFSLVYLFLFLSHEKLRG